jgi:hypothetical protein
VVRENRAPEPAAAGKGALAGHLRFSPPMTRPVHPTPAPPPAVAKLRALARTLDSAVQIPGTSVRFGADALLGLVPVVGDLAGAALSGYVVLSAARLGVSKAVLARMLVTLGAAALVGAVPLVGDLFDVGWRANTRNVALLERALAEPGAVRRQSGLRVAAVGLAVAALAVAGAAAAVWIVRALVGLAT